MKKKTTIGFIGLTLLFAIAFSAAFFITPQKTYKPEDENKLNIIILGDSIFNNDLSGKGLIEYLREDESVEVLDGCFGGTTAARMSWGNEPDYYTDKFNFYNIADILVTGNKSTAFDNTYYTSFSHYMSTDKINRIGAADADEFDFIVINYGLNDSLLEIPTYGRDKYDQGTYAGAMRSGIEEITDKFPNTAIIVDSVTYAACPKVKNDESTIRDNEAFRREYNEALKQIADEYDNVYYFDSEEFLELNADNYGTYLVDGVHFLDTTKELFADRFTEYLGQLK